MQFEHYIARDREFLDERFDFLITDETAKSWYDSSANQFMHERGWCKRHIKPGDVILDCGAHHGMMSVLFARWSGPEGRVIAYEALPSNAVVIEKNAALNGLANIKVRPVGVGEKPAFITADWNMGNVMVDAGKQGPIIELVRLDDDLPPDIKIDFLKLDVEGSDLHALRGARRILSSQPAIDLELHNFAFADRLAVLREIFQILSPDIYSYEVLAEILVPDFRPFDGAIDLDWLAGHDNPHVFCLPRNRDPSGARCWLERPEEIVAALYLGYLGRAPDADGLYYWTGRYVVSQNLQFVAGSFADPQLAESHGRYPFLSDPQQARNGELSRYLDDIHRSLFDRPADPTTDVDLAALSNLPLSLILKARGQDRETLRAKVSAALLTL